MRKFRLFLAVAALGAAMPQAASAAWYRASTKHFVVYGNQREDQIRAFARRLELFDRTIRTVRKLDDVDGVEGNQLTVYMVPSLETVERLAGSSNIGGFYIGRVSGSLAVVPASLGNIGDADWTRDNVFFHEYAHHLMLSDNAAAYPQWYVEGFAEFLSTVTFEKNGSIEIGRPPQGRAYSLFNGNPMPLEKMLSGKYDSKDPDEFDTLYSRGWLLTHYVMFNKERGKQLSVYLDEIGRGTAPLEAAQKGFGDLKQLRGDLDRYLSQNKFKAAVLPDLKYEPAISIVPLSEGASAIMSIRIQSKVGVDGKTAEPLAAKARAVEHRYPDDPLVELTLAEAELDAGHPGAASAAADRASHADPKSTDALIFKGRALAAGDAPTRFADARKYYLAANKLDSENPEALMYYYQSYVMEKAGVPKNAVDALHYASVLAPQDEGLRLTSASAYLTDGKLDEARVALGPVAYDPHGGGLAKLALAAMDKIKVGDAKGALAALTPSEDPKSTNAKGGRD